MNISYSEINNSKNDKNYNNLDNSELKQIYSKINKSVDKNEQVANKKVSFNNYNSYWEPKTEYEKMDKKSKSISYDDILNSMNMVVINGKLHFVHADKMKQNIQPNYKQNIQQNIQPNIQPNIQQNIQSNYKQNIQPNNQPNYQQNYQQNNNQNSNSYIYDKYFKSYKQESAEEDIPKVPLTPEEIKKNIIINRLKQIAERKRIEQIKSKKLLFDTSHINISHQANMAPPNLNKLFKFSNR